MADAKPGDRVRAILFDLDGTLIDTVALILSSFRHATATVLGAALPDDVLMRNVGVPLATQMREIAPERAEELLRVYREHNARHHDEMIAEYPGTREVLIELASHGWAMGVVTSKGAPMAARGLEALGLDGFFQVVVTADDVTTHKPDPHPLLHAAELMGVSPGECVYVGDSPHDMSAARAAGVVAVAALWGAFEPQVVMAPGPEYALRTITELPGLLAASRAARWREGAPGRVPLG